MSWRDVHTTESRLEEENADLRAKLDKAVAALEKCKDVSPWSNSAAKIPTIVDDALREIEGRDAD